MLDAMAAIHHPLRNEVNLPLLRPSLDLTAEIQRTGDIFFPLNWLNASLSGYQSPAAAQILQEYLAANPALPPRLRGKVLQAADDVYTNHIHADDLARATVLAMWRGSTLRVLNVNDDSDLRMAEYMDLAADLWQLPQPPRINRAQAEKELPPMTLSFMNESRRMQNQRLKTELRMKLRYPTVREGLAGKPVF